MTRSTQPVTRAVRETAPARCTFMKTVEGTPGKVGPVKRCHTQSTQQFVIARFTDRVVISFSGSSLRFTANQVALV